MTKAVLSGLLLSFSMSAYEYGPDPRYTGAPGDDPLACSTGSCHTGLAKGGPLNSAGGRVIATFSSGVSYTPGGPPITITVSVSDTNNTHFGFQMTARLESNLANGQAGDFIPGSNQIVICDDGSVKIKQCPAASPVEFIEHAYPAGSQVSTVPYVFTWTPPATNAGPVHFYVSGGAVNGNLMADAGDHIYTADYVLIPTPSSVSYVVLNNGSNNGLVRVFPDGSVSTIAAHVYGYAVAEEPNGSFGVVNAGTPGLQIVTPAGVVSTVVANPPNGSAWIAIAVDASGNFIIADNAQHAIWRVSPDGSSVTMVAHYPVASANELDGVGIAFDSSGNYIISTSDQTSPQLIRMTPAGVVTTIPITGIPSFYGAITSDGKGNFLAATDGAIYDVSVSGTATLVASNALLCCNLTGLARDPTTGNLLVTVNGGRLELVGNNGSAVTTLGSGSLNFSYPTSVVVDTLVALGPGDQLVTTFTAQPNTSDLLFFFNNDSLKLTGSPVFNVALFNGATSLGTYAHAPFTANGTTTFVSAFASAGGGSGAATFSPTTVDFTSIHNGTIKGRLVTTVSGGSVSGFNLADVVLYDAISTGPSQTPQTHITTVSVQLNPHPVFFAGEVNLGSDSYYLQFPDGNLFGYYNFQFFPVLYHYDLGFEFFVDANDGNAGAYLYDFASAHWFYTNPGLFPYLYDFTLGDWLYYLPDTRNAGHYTTAPRYFSDLTTGKIISM